MIVAPLMVPILGTSLAVAIGDRTNMVRCLLVAIVGAAAVVAIGYVIGLAIVTPVVAANDTQVAARVHPHLIDLLAALATGAVGAIALNRDDISDALPGVAIAISLVPPLSVCGLTLESGAPGEAGGALFLFLTNVAAILATRSSSSPSSGSTGPAPPAGPPRRRRPGKPRARTQVRALNRRRSTVLIGTFLVIIAVPLGFGSAVVARDSTREARLQTLAKDWADHAGWRVVEVTTSNRDAVVRAVGPGTGPDPAVLRKDMDDAGMRGVGLRVDLVPATSVVLPAR